MPPAPSATMYVLAIWPSTRNGCGLGLSGSAKGVFPASIASAGAFGPAEVQALRTDSFDPLARFDYYVHIWVGEERREGRRVDRFSAKVEDKRLVYEFSMPVAPPADPGEEPVVVSVFDRANEVAFRFAASDFLRVDGEVRAGCRFRVAHGRGEQSGHPQPATFECG